MMEILRLHSVIPANVKAMCESLIICHDQSSVAGSTKIFGRIETEESGQSHRAGLLGTGPTWIFGANSLCRVLDNRQAKGFCQRADLIHLAAQPEKMDRHDCANFLPLVDDVDRSVRAFRSQKILKSAGRQVKSLCVDIDKERGRADPCDAGGRGKKGVGSRYDGVAFADSECHQYCKKCVGARGDTYGELGAGVTANRLLKFFDSRPENKSVRA